MKKAAILTINDDWNYGNRLQNYAVQRVLEKHNLKVETIYNQNNVYGVKYFKKKVKDNIKKVLNIKKEIKKYNKFNLFNKNIKFAKFAIDSKHIPKKLGLKYDYFFTGSDQVWNPTFERMSDVDFLTFAPEIKRNSFSASFGINEIPKQMREYYRENLMKMQKISVREDIGKIIIKELTGRDDVEVLVDPTMLLTNKEWNRVAKKPKMLKTDKYILNYFLGELSEERKNEIEKIAKENECTVINILDKNSPFYQTGPSEFLYLEENAFLICTDSFHSCVFAILYNRPFIVFDREDKNASMNSRIETLLNKFELQDRKFNGKITKKELECDYENAYKILESEKEKADKFLRKVLEKE